MNYVWCPESLIPLNLNGLIAFCAFNSETLQKCFKRISNGHRQSEREKERERERERECSVNVPHSALLWVLNEIGGMWYPLHILCCNGTIPMAAHCVGYSCTYSPGMCLESGEQLQRHFCPWTNKLSAAQSWHNNNNNNLQRHTEYDLCVTARCFYCVQEVRWRLATRGQDGLVQGADHVPWWRAEGHAGSNCIQTDH